MAYCGRIIDGEVVIARERLPAVSLLLLGLPCVPALYLDTPAREVSPS